MVPFAGWEMPVQYSSIIDEHMAVREKAGLFDVSHMGEILVSGQKSPEFLEKMTCNHIGGMEFGQVRYNAVMNENGGLVDDITVYRESENSFFIVSNASNYETVYEHLKKFAPADVDVENQSDDWHQLAIQGPAAESIFSKLVDANLDEIKYYRFRDITYKGKKIRVSRTGYTGEDGFEIYSDNEIGVVLFGELLEAGKGEGILPAGLGARDALRLEAFYPLYGHELTADRTPVESGQGWIVKEKEIPFLGYEKVIAQKKNGPERKICGVLLKEGGVPREGYKIFDESGENELGEVLSGGYSPILKTGIGSSFLPLESAKAETPLLLEVRGRKLKAAAHTGAFVKGGAGAKK